MGLQHPSVSSPVSRCVRMHARISLSFSLTIFFSCHKIVLILTQFYTKLRGKKRLREGQGEHSKEIFSFMDFYVLCGVEHFTSNEILLLDVDSQRGQVYKLPQNPYSNIKAQ